MTNLSINGRLTLTVVKPDGTIREQRTGDNTMCTAGMTTLAAATVWSGLQDQATNLGLTTPVLITPLYGAVGSGAGVPAAADTQLFAELGRQTVGAGAAGPATPSINAQVTWLFYFPQPLTTWTVTEAGVFLNASTLVNAGTLLDHWAFGSAITVPTTDTLILQAVFSLAGL